MDVKDFIITPFGVEDPKIHTIAVNDQLFNIAIEMKTIVLLGASFNSVNSEYRKFNMNSQTIKEVFRTNKTFLDLKKLITGLMKKDALVHENNTLKNVAYQGIDYMLVYYIILKYRNFSEESFVILNSFAILAPAVSILDAVLAEKKFKMDHGNMKAFYDIIFKFEHVPFTLGSKVLTLSRSQVLNSNDLSQTIWKALYIHRIIRNIPAQIRQNLFSPALDWGLLRCSVKSVFTNQSIVQQIVLGERLHYIKTTSDQQAMLASKLFGKSHELKDIQRLTSELKEVTGNIDYILDDLLVIMFYPNMGSSFFKEIINLYEQTKRTNKLAVHSLVAPFMTNYDVFKQVMFQYLYGVFLLAKQGVIHNDPHLNNILLTKNTNHDKFKYQLQSEVIIAFDHCPINLTIIDYDKSILSHYHHNDFADTAHVINEEMAIVFESIKKNIVEDHQQIFTCYVMYDVVRFGMVMTRLLREVEDNLPAYFTKSTLKKHHEFLTNMIKLATGVLMKIYDPNPKFPFKMTGTHNSIEWLIVQMYDSNIKMSTTRGSDKVQTIKISPQLSNEKPEFVSSRRRYADALKQNYISQYISSEK